MSKFYCLAVQGLMEAAFGEPLAALAAYLNKHTPEGVHFNVVGGVDPQPFQQQFTDDIAAAVKAGATPIILGHSKGAMMMFYIADALDALGIRLPLVVSIDSTDWGSNAPGVLPWVVTPVHAGEWYVPANAERWIHFRQPVYPGGGYAFLAPGNDTTKLNCYERSEPHVALPITAAVQQIILHAVRQTIGAEA